MCVFLPMLFVILGRTGSCLSTCRASCRGYLFCVTWGCTVHDVIMFNFGRSLFKVVGLVTKLLKVNKECTCTYLQHYCFHIQGLLSVLSITQLCTHRTSFFFFLSLFPHKRNQHCCYFCIKIYSFRFSCTLLTLSCVSFAVLGLCWLHIGLEMVLLAVWMLELALLA